MSGIYVCTLIHYPYQVKIYFKIITVIEKLHCISLAETNDVQAEFQE